MPTLSNKGIITREICETQIKSVKSPAAIIIGAAIVPIGLANISHNIAIGVIFILAGAFIAYFGISRLNLLNRSIERREYFLTEDVTVKVKESRINSKGTRNIMHYTFTFAENGSYTVSDASPHVIQIRSSGSEYAADLNEEALKCFYEGEHFYVLAIRSGKKTKIVQIFNICYFDIDKNEFFETDGKYYPKLS